LNTLWGPCLGRLLTFLIFRYSFALCMFRRFQAVHRTFDLLMLFVLMITLYFTMCTDVVGIFLETDAIFLSEKVQFLPLSYSF
jgi:hypothetical protein